MKCLFIHFSINTTVFYSHAIATLSAIAKAINFNVDLLIIEDLDYEKYLEIILKKQPDIVAFSLTSLYWEEGKKLAEKIKTKIFIPLWVGGNHINALPETFLKSPFDAACYGDGEDEFKHALTYLKFGKVYSSKSWLVKGIESKLHLNIINNLNDYPLPDIQLFHPKVILNYASLYFSKGCIYSCNYCMSRNGGYANKIRWKTVERAIEECLQLVTYCNPPEMYFDDDTFVKNISWVTSFLKEYSVKVKVPFYCNSRPELLSDNVCNLLKNNYCCGVGIGIESGSESVRKYILKRNVSNKQIIDAFDRCKLYGLETWSFNMVNIPKETIEDLNMTINLNSFVNPDYVRVSVFTPFPGSPMYIQRKNYSSFFTKDFKRVKSSEKRITIMKWLNKLDKEGKLWND